MVNSSQSKHRAVILPAVIALLAVTLPYVLGFIGQGTSFRFIGMLVNPVDNASYLAKMMQGWNGAWRFTLPYTAETGVGAPIFLYYLFLGHLARWLGLPVILIYHLARVLGAVALLASLTAFFRRVYADRADLLPLAFWLAVLGAGMGWLVVGFGLLPSDLWVAEAYPFLAMMTNPHFPLGLALVVGSFILVVEPGIRWRLAGLLLAGLLLATVFPFGEVVVVLVTGGWAVWEWRERHHLDWLPVVCVGALGGPYLLYQLWMIQSDPLLALWNAQNLTASPVWWDLLLSFSPALLLAPLGILEARRSPAGRLVIVWLAISLGLIVLPSPLQRRFLLGFFIPTVLLAGWGLDLLRKRNPRLGRLARLGLIGFSLPTNLVLLVLAGFGIFSHAPMLYLTRDESRALNWLRDAAPPNSLVLASPEMGLWIPAVAGQRVVYGHPFETVHAEQEQAWVTEIYQTGADGQTAALLAARGVDYWLVGPRERLLGGAKPGAGWTPVLDLGTVQIYAAQGTAP